jgi:hypothetical protein
MSLVSNVRKSLDDTSPNSSSTLINDCHENNSQQWICDHRIEQNLDPIFGFETFQLSDHCIHGLDPFFGCVTVQPDPNGPIYESVSPVTDHTLDFGCNEYPQSRLSKRKEDANLIYRRFDDLQPSSTLPDKRVHEKAFYCIDPALLARQAHEPQNFSLTRLDPTTGRTPAENLRPQLFTRPFSYDIQHNSPTSTTSIRATSKYSDTSEAVYSSPSSLPSSGQFTPQTTSLFDVDQACSDASDGKIALPRTMTTSVCGKCKKSFSTRACYHRHIKERSCHALSKCNHCGKSFKLAKDLKRHLGSDKASSSCNKLENPSRSSGFVCICHKSYTRKDSLMRHLRAPSTEGHCCRACKRNPCHCS